MSIPRTVVDETLPISRIVVTGDINSERIVVEVQDQPRIAVTNTGEDITVNVFTSSAGTNSVNGLQGDVTLTSSNITEGSNQYYTQARADARVAAGIAAINFPVDSVNGKTESVVLTTSDIAEGTNKYYTDAKVVTIVESYDYASKNFATTAAATAETTAKSYADTRIANLVSSAPATLDTLNELATALGNDANFATTITTALGTKLATADFNNTFDNRLATKTTANLTEGSNQYFTTTRARTAISVSGNLAYNSSTGVISYTQPTYATVATTGAYSDLTGKPTAVSSFTNDANYITVNAITGGTGVTVNSGSVAIGQSVATSADVTFNSITANINDGARSLGQLYLTRSLSYTPPGSSLTTVAGTNGIVIASSNPGSGNGYSPQVKIVYASGDTTSGTNSAPGLQYNTSSGTTGSPSAVAINQTVGTINFDGYATSGWAQTIATTGSGAGTTSLSPLQIQGYAREAFTDSAGTVTAAGMGFRVRGFQVATAMSTANRTSFIDHTLTTATYKANTLNIQGGTTTTNYATFASTGHTIGNLDAVTTYVRARTATAAAGPVVQLKNTTTATTTPVTGDGGTFRIGTAGSNATQYQIAEVGALYSSTGDNSVVISIANGDQTGATLTAVTTINTKPSSTTIYAGTPSATPGATTVAQKLTVDTNKVTAFVPVALPNYSATNLRAITGSTGWMASVNTSGGKIAYWDTTNARWSFVIDGTAV